MNKPQKIGRTITALMFIGFAIFCIATLTVEFTIWFLLLALIALGFAFYSLKKAYFSGTSVTTRKSKVEDDFEL